MAALQSLLLSSVPGIVHGFGTRAEPLPVAFKDHWEKDRPRWKQVHGTTAFRIAVSGQDAGETDAFYTSLPGQLVPIVTGDCVPILMARRDGSWAATVHAGWRGTRARIVEALWRELSQLGQRPQDWVAAIGPSIGSCCYEVSEELAMDFQREFAGEGASLAVPTFRHLDLPQINSAQLRAIGFADVEILPFCTFCAKSGNDHEFNSYRREGSGARQWSVIKTRQEI